MTSKTGAIIVTGASRGIGAAVAKCAARDGYSVAVNYSADEAGAQAVIEQIAANGGRAVAIKGDISREADIAKLFTETERLLGPIAGLVNNAGITGPLCRLEHLEADHLNRVLQINVLGVMLCSREAVRRMSTRNGGKGGSIVTISSRAAQLGGAGEWVHYAASKGAIDTFTIGLAREVAGEGIRVNAVSPGLIETGIHAAAGVPDRTTRLAHAIPMGRAGSAEEVAEVVMWLMSPAASYVTGAIVPVSGGR
jgi:NAD(P)-dependent dehydrogenase (short-subunit alcohol dehydrogenase family)